MTSTITHHQGNGRMSQIVEQVGLVYLAGQISAPGESVTAQTSGILSQIDTLLASVGTDKKSILSATIWLADMADFAEMNTVWDAWSKLVLNQRALLVNLNSPQQIAKLRSS